MIGKTISHYTILEELGRGGMGVVYKAEDTRLHRTVAIKFLSRALLSFGDDEKQRFYREAQAASQLEHPAIETVFEIDERDNDVFIVMAYVEGETLRKRIAASPAGLPIKDVIAFAKQIAGGLQAAHEQGIIHRDVKSDNVMISPRRQVKIMDFGLAKLRGASALTKTGGTVGTIGFMSPEQIRNEEVDQRADIWSFGVVLFEMLAGRLPFGGDHEAAVMYSILNEPLQPLRKVRADVPESLERLVGKCLEKNRASRYSSMAEVLHDLGTLPTVSDVDIQVESGKAPLLLSLRRPAFALPATVAVLAVAFVLYKIVDHTTRVRRVLEQTLPRVMKLVDDRRLAEAYVLGVEAERYIGDDSTLSRLMLQCSFRLTLSTNPAGVDVGIKPYSAGDSAWQTLGTSPLVSYRLPREPFHLRARKAGFLPVDIILAPTWDGGSFPADDTVKLTLDSAGTAPADMVRVPGGLASLALVGLEQEKPIGLGDYLIDRYEVTNKEFKRFVDAGGYRRQEFWRVPFEKDGRTMSWQEATALFRDATGRSGPSTWEMGTYPEDEDQLPVRGVSWYEAAAYAEFAGKSLPTIYQWSRAAGTPRSVLIVPISNYGAAGPAPVGTYKGLGPFGTYDMAGNVKEWVWNDAGRGKRYILGGAWSEPRYMFNDADAQYPFLRNGTYGFRCAKTAGTDPDRSYEPVVIPARDFSKERPVPDNIFAVYRSLYSYDRTDLQPALESRDSSEEYWTREKVTFKAAYGNERVVAYLFLPKSVSPPYQVVVYFPGSNALHLRSSAYLEIQRIDLIIKSGRAVMYPVYKSTYERGDGLETDVPDTTVSYRDHVLMWAKDCSRSIDYLESRSDMRKDKLAYFGVSWGAVIGNIIPAVDQRFRAVVLQAGGLSMQRSLPEVEQLNFVPRIKAPTLMVNGVYDFFFPVELSQMPLFNLLRMPESQKRKVVFEGGHSVPRVESFREILDWLDRYLGPVDR